MQQLYEVSFFKKLTDSTGHPYDVCQRAVEVKALTEDRAIEAARRKFAEMEGVCLWSLRADYEKLKLLPSRRLPPRKKQAS